MNPAKIRLSAKEMELVTNADWILTKNGIIQKVKQLLSDLQLVQESTLQKFRPFLPARTGMSPAKISKGENYKGLPYLILDHPRFFSKDDVFAIRTLFWWGHFFSVTLHLSGASKHLFEKKILAMLISLQSDDFFICTGNDEWEHHFEKDNYTALKNMNREELEQCITQKPFLKLAQHIPLQQWDDAHTLLAGSFSRLLSLLAD